MEPVRGSEQEGVCLRLARRRLRSQSLPGGGDSLANRSRALARRCGQLLPAHARHRKDEVEAVEERAGKLVSVAGEPLRGVAALRSRIAASTARAEVHRSDELETSGKDDAAGGSRDGY